MFEFEPIVGRFFTVSIDGAEHRVYVEEAGKGLPLLCLHTAGADSRQYRHLLNDPEIIEHFRVVAFDLPYHGRSTARRMVAEKIPADDGVICGNGPHGMARAGTRTADRLGLFDGWRDRTQDRR